MKNFEHIHRKLYAVLNKQGLDEACKVAAPVGLRYRRVLDDEVKYPCIVSIDTVGLEQRVIAILTDTTLAHCMRVIERMKTEIEK